MTHTDFVTFSPHGNFLAVKQIVGGITLWNINTGERLRQLPGETLAFNNNETTIATGLGRFRSQVWLWDIETGNLLAEYVVPLVATQLYWTLDDQTIFVSSSSARLVDDGLNYTGEGIRGWNVNNQELESVLTISHDYSLPIVLNEEEVLIGFSDFELEQNALIWNRISDEIYRVSSEPESVAENYTITTHPLHILGIGFDNNVLITWYGNKIFFWDIVNNELLTYTQMLSNTTIIKIEQYQSHNLITLTNDYRLTIWNSL